MPEGHTIHRLARDLNSSLRPGPVAASSPQGLFAIGAARLDQAELERAWAYGKHLFMDFGDAEVQRIDQDCNLNDFVPAPSSPKHDAVSTGRRGGRSPSSIYPRDSVLLHIHLGLIGKLRRKDAGAPIVGEIRLRLENETATWDLTGPMVCALIDPDRVDEVTRALGPDPLRRGAKSSEFTDRLSRKSIPVAAALLDQSVIAGLGNVFRSEFCYLAGIDPRTPAKDLSAGQAAELWALAVEHLRLGVRLNRIVTRDPKEVGASAGRIDDENRLYVYNRGGLPCHRCGDEISMLEIAKRKSWYCPTCQT